MHVCWIHGAKWFQSCPGTNFRTVLIAFHTLIKVNLGFEGSQSHKSFLRILPPL